jgi:hypothetical protein
MTPSFWEAMDEPRERKTGREGKRKRENPATTRAAPSVNARRDENGNERRNEGAKKETGDTLGAYPPSLFPVPCFLFPVPR